MRPFYVIIIAFTLCLPYNLMPQSLEIVGDKNIEKTADLNEYIDIYFSTSIKNVGPGPVSIKVKTQVVKIANGHSYDVCWNGLCSPPTTEDWVSSDAYKLNPGETTPQELFYTHYYSFFKFTDPVEGEGNILYTFYNEMNPNDKIEIDAKYKFVKGQKVLELFSNPDINFSLEGKQIQIISQKFDEINLELYDINGNLITSQTFSGSYCNNFNHLSTGTYYLKLSVNGKTMSTGKFILK